MVKLRKVGFVSLLLAALILSPGTASAQESAAPKSKRLPRAYPGAPPLIPHDAEVRKGLCLACHETGVGGAPIVPHPTRNHFCLQCHVGQDLSAKPFISGSAPVK